MPRRGFGNTVVHSLNGKLVVTTMGQYLGARVEHLEQQLGLGRGQRHIR